MRFAIGIDLGGTKTAAGLVDETGRVIARVQTPTPARNGPAAVVAAMAALAGRLSSGHDRTAGELCAVGVGAAGVIDPRTRTVLAATDTLPGWAGTRIGDELERAVGLPVSTINDVHAHALGEAVFGAGRGRGTVLVVAAGTGIGGAVVVDGALQLGAHCAAGHFGHLPAAAAAGLVCSCGRSGHVEMIAAGPAIPAAYLRAGGDGAGADTRGVFARAAAGDTLARTVIDTAADALGGVIGGLVNAVDPDIVVVAGGLAAAGESWWSPLRAGIRRELMPIVADCAIAPAALGPDAALVGAAFDALNPAAAHRENRPRPEADHHPQKGPQG